MLSKHPGRCRFPHGHTRTIEVVVSSDGLDANDMVVDFKALKLALLHEIERFDHAMAVNASDPMAERLFRESPESTIVFEGEDPTTEVLARYLYERTAAILSEGFESVDLSGITYRIPRNSVDIDRIRVWETPESWAEYGI